MVVGLKGYGVDGGIIRNLEQRRGRQLAIAFRIFRANP